MVQSNSFPNIGYIIGDVPRELFNNIREECEIVNRARYDLSLKEEVMYPGLTSKGVTKHYYMKKHIQGLKNFILDMCNVYIQEYPGYISGMKPLTNDVPFFMAEPWVNIQEKSEFLPNHIHEGVFSYVIWVKIPYDINEEVIKNCDSTTKFEFSYNNILGNLCQFKIAIDSSYEGKIMMFPSLLTHCVYPFYTSNENRISISGNVKLDTLKYAEVK